MTDLILWVGIIGNVTWVLLFLSPAHIFYRIVRNRSTEDFESISCACALLSAAIWVYYGIIKPNSILVATANVFGIVIETIYLILFLIYGPTEVKGDTAAAIVTVDVVFLGAVVSGVEIFLTGEMRMYVIAFLAAALNIMMYGSFLLPPMRTVATTENVEYVPFFPSLFCFLNGGIWAFYAILVKDLFLWVPNALGFLIGTVQLFLYFKCLRRNPNGTIILSEYRSQREPLLASLA